MGKSEALETIKKICGGLTIALGVVSAFWDGMELIGAYDERRPDSESKMGRELRRIADQMENRLREHDGG